MVLGEIWQMILPTGISIEYDSGRAQPGMPPFDWCLEKFAQLLGKSDDAVTFKKRAQNYRNIYDPTVQSMRARDRDGKWIAWNPDNFGWNSYYNHSNEPVHHVPYPFVYAGKPWLTQRWVRRIFDQAYHNDVNGIVGNDDVGQMSPWYVLGAIGFHLVCPGDGVYILGSPLFETVTLSLYPAWYRGKTFSIIARNNGEKNCYIEGATLNGKPLTCAWKTHDEIVSGGTLELSMSPVPNKRWGTAIKDLPQARSKSP
jgi:putative alpha-1,2-mannosidase